MSKAIELLSMLHSAKSFRWETARGRSNLGVEELNGAVALAEKDSVLGSHLIRAKYLDDHTALTKAYNMLSYQAAAHLSELEIRPITEIVMCIIMVKPLPSQYRTISSAWKRHSSRGNRSKKTIQKFNQALNSLSAALIKKESAADISRVESQIEMTEQRLNAERQDLERYADAQAKSTIACPRCRGVGEVNSNECKTCSGKGVFIADEKDIRKAVIGAGLKGDAFYSHYLPAIEALLTTACQSENDAVDAINKRVEREKSHAIGDLA
ncbi:TIGR02642 family protein [Vibrio litoralis]|uniref:TIGR02642 family protein n=1 Tax=Vibrio litoralis TaxID=335972 RepID=UPI0003FB0FE6|nr:TIGR02642 family protein [Vibrio litoralis]